MNNHIIKRAATAIVIVITLLIALSVSGCSGKEERIAKHLERAKTFYSDADYEKARVEFKNVLQMNPKNIDAIVGQAKVYEKLEKWRESAGLFQRAIDLDKTRNDAKENLARIYFLAGGYEKALKIINEVLKTNPTSIVALTVKGALLAQKGELSSAMTLVDAALSSSPDYVDAIMLKASLLMQNKEYEKALLILDQGLKVHRDHPGIITVMAKINADLGHESNTIDLLQKLVKAYPDNMIYRGRLASYYVHLKKNDLAEQVFRDGIQQMPELNQPKIAYIDYLLKSGNAEKAISELQGYLKNEQSSAELQLTLARLYESTGKNDLAIKQLSEIILSHELDPDGLKARVQLAKIAANETRYEDAKKLVAEVLKENPRDNDGLLIKSKLSLIKNDFPSAISDLRAVLRDQPNSVEVLNLLGRAHLANKEVELAKEQFDKAISLSLNRVSLQYQIGQLYLKYGETDAALPLLEQASQVETTNINVLEALFKAQLLKKDYASARDTSQRVRENYPEKSLGDYLAGLVDSAEGMHTSALKHYKIAMKKTPSAVEPLKALVNSRLALKQVNGAITDLKSVLKAEPKHFAAQNILGELYLLQNKPKEAIGEFRKALVINPQLATSFRGIASAYIALNDREKAIHILRNGIESVEHHQPLVNNLAALYENGGEIDKAIDVYNVALSKNPSSVVYSNNLAMLLASNKSDKASLDRAGKLILNLRGHETPAYLDTMGWVYYSRGKLDQALPILQKAVIEAPSHPLLQYHLAMVQYKKGDVTSAKTNLQDALNANETFKGVEEAKKILRVIDEGS